MCFLSQGDVFFYYGLINFHQNLRQYMDSRDDGQMIGRNKNLRVATVNLSIDSSVFILLISWFILSFYNIKSFLSVSTEPELLLRALHKG